MTDINRMKVLGGILLLLLGLFLWNWIAGWGLVTIRAYDDTFASIQRSIERQGGIKIVSNVPPDTRLGMEVEKVSAAEAVEVLAARVDGRWSVTYVSGPSKPEIADGIQVVVAGDSNDDFRILRARGGWMPAFDAVPDVRKIRWEVSAMEEATLGAYLNQLVQKTGASVVMPTSWNPAMPTPPKGGEAGSSVRSMVQAAGGRVEEVFSISARADGDGNRGEWGGDGEWSWAGGGGRQGSQNATGEQRQREVPAGAGAADGRRPNPEWARERMVAQIEQLPLGEREVARKDYEEMQTFMEEVRQMNSDQRQAAIEQRMNDPAAQERMLERELRRDLNRGPDRRAARYRNYISRKEARRNAQ